MKKKVMLPALLAVLGLIAAACGGGSDTASSDLSVLRVAYFEGWPLPVQIGQADGSFAEAVGVDEIEWIPAANGGVMTEGMVGGSVDIAFSQGLTPFAGAINAGQDLELVGIAVSYAEADNCVAAASLGADRDNAASALEGATVMTPFGNVTHYKMLEMMQFLGVDLDSLDIVEATDGATTAATFEQGQIDVGCAFGGPLVSMLDGGGNLLLTGAEQEEEIDIFTYDIVSIPRQFGEDNPEVVTNFLSAMDDFNNQWLEDPNTNNPIIAAAAGMDSVGDFLAGDLWFDFPTIEEQLSTTWLGGNVGDAMEAQVTTLFELGGGTEPTGDFQGSVNTSFLEDAN